MNFVEDKNVWSGKIISHPSFLQSWQWGELQKKIARRVFRLDTGEVSASIIEQNLPFGQKYFYSPHGPVIQKENIDAWLNLKDETMKIVGGKKPIFLRIEPLNHKFRNEPIEKSLEEAGFRRAKPVQPKTTLQIDLRKDEARILDEMEHNTRYSIRAAEKRGVAVDFFEGNGKEKSFETFWEIFSETNKRHGLKAYSKEYYEEVARLEGDCFSKIAIAKVEREPVSAAVFVYFGKKVFYLFAGSKSGYGKFNAPTYLIWRAMVEAKNSGYRYFDFWGISNENKNWSQITAFKKSFGGEEITSAGTWDYVFSGFRYFIYNLIKLALSFR